MHKDSHHFDDCRCTELERCVCDLRRYWKVFKIAVAVFIFQLLGSLISGSLALLADTFHVGFHVLEFLLIVGIEYWVVKRSLSGRFEGGLRLAGGLFGSVFLLATAGIIIGEAISRLKSPPEIVGWLMMAVAIVGGLGNWWQHKILSHSESEHITQNWAEQHIWSDFLQSASVVLGGMFVFIGYPIVDLLVSGLVGVKIIHSAVGLLIKIFKPST